MLFTRQQLIKRQKTGLIPSKPRLGEFLPNLAKTKSRLRDILLSPVLAFCAIYAVTAVTALVAPYAHSPILACSMGASAVILFVAPNSRFSTPWRCSADICSRRCGRHKLHHPHPRPGLIRRSRRGWLYVHHAIVPLHESSWRLHRSRTGCYAA